MNSVPSLFWIKESAILKELQFHSLTTPSGEGTIEARSIPAWREAPRDRVPATPDAAAIAANDLPFPRSTSVDQDPSNHHYSSIYQDVTKQVHRRAVGRWHAYEKYLVPVWPVLARYLREFRYDRAT